MLLKGVLMTASAQGNILVPVVMFGWIPAVLLLFYLLSPKKAAAAAFVAGWMFLPVIAYQFQGLPDYTKMTATCLGILLGALVYDRRTLFNFRPKAVDIPMLLWCTAPFFSSVANQIQGSGVYDGLSETMYQTISWGLPYFIGRIYFTDHKGITILAKAVFIGGLVYIPFCMFEMIMSPQIHRLTYGYHQHSFLQTIRAGGFRPMVYMEHGLMAAIWMTSATSLGIWLSYSKMLPSRILSIPTNILIVVLLATTFMMKSTGAIFLFLVGISFLFLTFKMKHTLLIWLLLLIPPGYIVSRTTGIWSGENLSTMVSEKFSPERGQSLQFRFDNEKILIDKAMEGTFFGWGGWGRSRVYDEKGRDISVTDGLWIIVLGTRGIYGITLLLLTIQLPMLLLLFRVPPGKWGTQLYAPVSMLAVLLAIYMIDNLLNAMVNPIFMLFTGGLVGLLIRPEYSDGEPEAASLPREEGMEQQGTRFITEITRKGTRFITKKDS